MEETSESGTMIDHLILIEDFLRYGARSGRVAASATAFPAAAAAGAPPADRQAALDAI